jgi:hypothetical protein
MPAQWVRQGQILKPWGLIALEEMQENVRDGARCNIQFLKARDPEQLEKFWALCTVVAAAVGTTKGTIRRWVSKRVGFVDEIVDIGGITREVPRSIALWGELEEKEFDEFFDLCVAIFAQEMGTAPEALQARFNEIMAGRAR